MIASLAERASSRDGISEEEALRIASLEGDDLFRLFSLSSILREKFKGKRVDLCAIVNAKAGACSEDCAYCAQSSKSNASTPVYPLIRHDAVTRKAEEARAAGANRFCIVTSGRKPGRKDLFEIASMIGKVRNVGLLPCATLGLLNRDELAFLRDSGLERYHHNLETSESFFHKICSTHTYDDKMSTIEAAKSVGLSLCSGGIFGLGESWHDRIKMAFAVRELDVDAVPINFLIPHKGTPMEERRPLHPLEALKIISLFRFILPQKEIRVCGGRRQVLSEFNSLVFFAGADSLLTGNYLTTKGTAYEDDLILIRDHGLEVG